MTVKGQSRLLRLSLCAEGVLTIHSMRLLTILIGGGRDQARLSVARRGDHPRTALNHRTEHMLGLKHMNPASY